MTNNEQQRVIDELQTVIDETQHTIERFVATGMGLKCQRIMKSCWRFSMMR
ncbi:hypothetical protein QC823_10715 [Halomonas vilamensis]|uniref:Uncharacterized protein n=1 Tax=Vreelandella vilamensis TaxID=531309 RepID=A0ABU1H573_9GAMM|nr:hypothetical protein [Halomonas vilamensis]MDR5899460.1 hypothetical protein [Halomonas vilamensis]